MRFSSWLPAFFFKIKSRLQSSTLALSMQASLCSLVSPPLQRRISQPQSHRQHTPSHGPALRRKLIARYNPSAKPSCEARHSGRKAFAINGHNNHRSANIATRDTNPATKLMILNLLIELPYISQCSWARRIPLQSSASGFLSSQLPKADNIAELLRFELLRK